MISDTDLARAQQLLRRIQTAVPAPISSDAFTYEAAPLMEALIATVEMQRKELELLRPAGTAILQMPAWIMREHDTLAEDAILLDLYDKLIAAGWTGGEE